MSLLGILPTRENDEHLAENARGRLLTFITPAPSGCNLKCSFCFIRQRGKKSDAALQPHHYVQFICEAAAASASQTPIALSIQGHEPLLPEARSYTQAILAAGTLLDIPAGLVTNGTFLKQSVDWLATFAPTKIAVSLDAATAAPHDQLRGVAGAFDATVAGIRSAVRTLAPHTKIAVASVLTPKYGSAPLEDMPYLLRALGVSEWLVNPLHRVGRDGVLGGPAGSRQVFYENLARLQDAADANCITLIIDDELDYLEHDLAVLEQPELNRFYVRTIPANIELLRLGPGGEVSAGRGILQAVTDETPRWYPHVESAGAFLARALTPISAVVPQYIGAFQATSEPYLVT
jgi:sulfatase maturation enzyme AslB (radical SAM superfamily)